MDKIKTELFGCNSRNHVCRKDGDTFKLKNMVPTVKFEGGSIMGWGCFSAKGIGNISEIDILICCSIHSILDANFS